MELTPREKDKLVIFSAALLAEQRMGRGVKLNDPEAVAYLSAAILEGARDGRTAAELMSRGAMLLTRDDVMDGVPEMVAEVQAKPAMVLKGGMIAAAAMGDPNVSIPGTGRWHADAVLRGPPQVMA